MTKFDVAVGLDEAALNKALAQLFGHAGIQEKVARGSRKIPTPIGEIDITCEVKVKGDLSDEQLQTIKRLIAYSPVHGMVAEHNKIESSVVRG